MGAKFQLVIDCADPDRMAHFWAEALRYRIAAPPAPHATWEEFWRSKGVPEEELGSGDDRIEDPEGRGPSLWFQPVEERKRSKNRLHIDLGASGGYEHSIEVRRQRVDAEADRLVKIGARRLEVLEEAGVDHYAISMQDPEGNEFDIN
jgi:Glyoxalase-like domain